jgi:hypothetical protein
MDFENMTVEELKTVAGWEVARGHGRSFLLISANL